MQEVVRACVRGLQAYAAVRCESYASELSAHRVGKMGLEIQRCRLAFECRLRLKLKLKLEGAHRVETQVEYVE